MTNSPTWVSVDEQLGYPAPGVVDSGRTINSVVVSLLPVGTMAKFRDVGTTLLGEAEFIWLPGVASTAAGDWVTFVTSNGVANTGATTRWAGTASTGYPIAVATAATVASTWGWYQVRGSAICNTNGTIAAGNGAAWQATATVQAAAVTGKNVTGVQAFSANGVPTTNQAIYYLMYPAVQVSSS